ncbi:hypothetical protein FisN_25Hh045 [Fistulifera solaris]|uniref:Uncharacterized protein n=1 Tax=Fistulifera solaris TaxID=1519565 RepID=A0A1Z5JVJ6_FISSO|nr:hypothetical protein FisN_25Hh045 [Fistulifera solaris]|eukprot:GAX18070.1 hypothetical protein FisN_25Hh045 [Fistulifera solaris]
MRYHFSHHVFPLCVLINALPSFAFVFSSLSHHKRQQTCLFASGKGFGKQEPTPRPAPAKTYGKNVNSMSNSPLPDISDVTMMDFFDNKSRWIPMFRELSMGTCLAVDALRNRGDVSEQHVHTALPDKPSEEKDMSFLSAFLDSMHQSLLDIPITNSPGGKDDDNDLHFMEEGRRLMAIQRFHVASPSTDLFATCWSEIYELKTQNVVHTGSLILVPHVSLQDLDEFCATQVLRPLEWLGLQTQFEVASLQRDSPAIRLLYQLQDMPDIPDNPDAYA